MTDNEYMYSGSEKSIKHQNVTDNEYMYSWLNMSSMYIRIQWITSSILSIFFFISFLFGESYFTWLYYLILNSIWTIDLGYLLLKYKIKVEFTTITLGVDDQYAKKVMTMSNKGMVINLHIAINKTEVLQFQGTDLKEYLYNTFNSVNFNIFV